MEDTVIIKDKKFVKFIEFQEIQKAVSRLAQRINEELRDQNPLFVAVLNGAFMFAAELLKEVDIPCEITFVRLASYHGTTSSNQVQEVLGLNESIEGRTVVIVEDIVDSGNTMVALKKRLHRDHPKELRVATLLLKPHALKQELEIEYVALEIPNDFIVGYGLDYDGYGRNLKNIYRIEE